jgi:hypothetical protein
METELKRRCNNCKFFMTQDDGYSSYTVSNTTVYCLKDKNEYFPCEESYSWEREDSPDYKQLQVAETCQFYKEDTNGQSLRFDVDEDVTINDCKDEEIKQAYNEWDVAAK